MNHVAHGLVAVLLACACAAHSHAQQASRYEKDSFNYSEWTKGRFAEVVSVRNPGRLLFFGGVGAEDETGTTPGPVRFTGDFGAQCRYAWDKIKRMLEKQGSSLSDVVKATTYVTDVRDFAEHGKCRREVFTGVSQPAGTFVVVNNLALPGMLIEVDVIAAPGK
jgi:enamine deaminase RidA (YjgF/YER057c/UK114 family)